jgi:hypothetical protein
VKKRRVLRDEEFLDGKACVRGERREAILVVIFFRALVELLFFFAALIVNFIRKTRIIIASVILCFLFIDCINREWPERGVLWLLIIDRSARFCFNYLVAFRRRRVRSVKRVHLISISRPGFVLFTVDGDVRLGKPFSART